jgi:nucleotidyltransferase/DNA polymerase involved in DNA repair
MPASRAILHVDMDAFYAAVEQRDDPSLRSRPVVVGADPRGGKGRGVVSTASYEARRFGVHSAMPISIAYRLCPHGVYLPVDMEKYASVSREVIAILRRYTDLVEPLSIDEAFLDVTGSGRAFGPAQEIARALKRDIRNETRLTASVGVASTKLVAKVASDLRKPDGLVVVPPGKEAAFLAPLPIRRLWGVGPKLEQQLAKLGIQTIGDLARVPKETLERRFGTHGHDLVELARGVDERPVVADGADAKSVGHEHTFDEDTADRERLRRTLLDLADSVARRLRAASLRGRTVTLKYRDETFHTVTRAETLRQPTDSGETLFRVAFKLFESVHGSKRVRLVGISASGFDRAQLELFVTPASPADRLQDAVAERFGAGALVRASLVGRRERRHPEAKDAVDKATSRQRR